MSKTKKSKKQKQNNKLKGYKPYTAFKDQDEFEKTFAQTGKFRVTSEFLMQEFKIFRQIMRDVVVVDVAHDAITGTIVFLGISKHFEKTEGRMMDNVPEYSLKIETKEALGKHHYKYVFEKVFDKLSSNAIH